MPYLKPNGLAALPTLKDALTHDFQLVESRLFGSKVRGDEGRDDSLYLYLYLYLSFTSTSA